MTADEVAALFGDAPLVDPVALERVRRIGGDDLLRGMIDAFLGHVTGRIEDVESAADAATAGAGAHAIRSSAGNLGLVRLARVAEAIEARADVGDPTWTALLPALAAAFAEARIALAEEIGGEP